MTTIFHPTSENGVQHAVAIDFETSRIRMGLRVEGVDGFVWGEQWAHVDVGHLFRFQMRFEA